MIRQGVFGMVLGLAQVVAPQADPIPMARLVADAKLPVGLTPGATASDDAVWIPDVAAGAIVKIDAKDNKVNTPVTVGSRPCASVVAAFSSVWVPACGERQVVRVNQADSKVAAKAAIEVADTGGAIASGIGSIWAVIDRKGIVARIDADTNKTVAEINIPGGAAAVLFAADVLWITSGTGNRLTRVNAHNHEIVATIDVGPKPVRLAAADGAVWTLNQGDGSVTRVDADTNKVIATIKIGDNVAAGDIAAGAGSVWISAPGVPLVRIDPRTNKVAQRFSGDAGGAVLVAHGSLWIAAGPQTTWRLDPRLVAGLRP